MKIRGIIEEYDNETLKMTEKFILPEDEPFWTWQMFVGGLSAAMFMLVCGVMR